VSRKLIVTDGRRERELLLVSRIVVGRDPTCDLSEADPLLSRRHAEFAVDGDSIVVRDLGSRNGIYVNGSRIAEGTLESGDIVRIGRLQLRYVEDSAPLTAMPELADDATGIVFPGPRGAAGTPTPAAKPQTPAKPAQPDADEEPTAYVPGPARKQPHTDVASGSSGKISPAPSVQPLGSRLQPAADDDVQPTRVVPPPARKSAVQPPADAMKTALQPPPSPPPEDADEPTSVMMARPRTAVRPPHAPPVEQTAIQPPPAPPTEDADEPTSVVLSRPRTGVQPRPDSAPADTAREARALATAVEAIATFLGASAVSRSAADAVKSLERDLANVSPPSDLVHGLKGLAARVSAAVNDLP
jgi:FHA domain